MLNLMRMGRGLAAYTTPIKENLEEGRRPKPPVSDRLLEHLRT